MTLPRVLLVDDHRDTREIFSVALQHHNFSVTESSDGEDALGLAAELLPSVLVTDLHLPTRDGCSLVAALRQNPITRHIPVLVVTADSRESVRDAALLAGAAVVLLKPVSVQALLDGVKALTPTHEGPEPG